MRLQEHISKGELKAVERMIDAHIDVRLAKDELLNAEMRLNDKIKALSDACFSDGHVRTLPETFVIEHHSGLVFIIALDVDDWTHHDIKQVGGLIA